MIIALISLIVTLVMQLIRAFFPLVYGFWEQTGYFSALLMAIGVFLIPIFVPILLRVIKLHHLFIISLTGMLAVRIAAQIFPIHIYLIAAGIAFSLLFFTVIIPWLNANSDKNRLFAAGVFSGMILDTTLHSYFSTWDYLWQRDFISLKMGIVLPVIIALLVKRSNITQQLITVDQQSKSVLSLMAVGPFFVLQFLFLQNVAFVIATADLSLLSGTMVVLVGNFIALIAIGWQKNYNFPRWVSLLCGLILSVLIFLCMYISGPAICLIVIIAQFFSALLLLGIFQFKEPSRGMWYIATSVVISGVHFIALVFLYQLDYELPLLFSNEVYPLAASLLLMFFVQMPLLTSQKLNKKVLLIHLLAFLVPFLVWITEKRIDLDSSEKNSLRIVNYNIHEAVNFRGIVDPEAIAQVILKEKPDIVALQEVGRGWPIGGGLDCVIWLAKRLQMTYIYAPAADNQFGNAILSRVPIKKWSKGFLPQGTGSMARGYIKVEVACGERTLTIINTHLQHRKYNTSVRIPQIKKLITIWQKRPATVIVGDMNAVPGSEEIQLFEEQNFINAQDATNNSELFTSSSLNPNKRIDWIFATPDIKFSRFSIQQTTASDHLPVAATIELK